MRAFGSALFLAALIVASPLAAQSIDSLPSAPQGLAGTERPPAYVATLDGNATITRAGESVALDLHAPVIEGDRLRVDSGFVELRWADGTSLFLDSRTTLDIVSIERMRLSEGQARFVAGRGAASGDVGHRHPGSRGAARPCGRHAAGRRCALGHAGPRGLQPRRRCRRGERQGPGDGVAGRIGSGRSLQGAGDGPRSRAGGRPGGMVGRPARRATRRRGIAAPHHAERRGRVRRHQSGCVRQRVRRRPDARPVWHLGSRSRVRRGLVSHGPRHLASVLLRSVGICRPLRVCLGGV